jgi:HEAT repeats
MKNSESGIANDRVLAIAALIIALLALCWPRTEPPFESRDVKALSDEVVSLRERMKRLEGAPVAVSSETLPEPAGADGVTIRQVHQWVWGLEQRLVQLEQVLAEVHVAPGTTPPPAPAIAQSRQVALNPDAAVAERLAALRALRGANGRTSDIVQAMLKLQATEPDANVRADVFRQLSGVTDPITKPHLINGVLKDQDARVREEAAETLAPFWSDPYVQSALRSAAENDPDEKVRKQARESLERKGKR